MRCLMAVAAGALRGGGGEGLAARVWHPARAQRFCCAGSIANTYYHDQARVFLPPVLRAIPSDGSVKA